MADNHIGAVLVSDQRGIAGIVTDRDLALAVLGSDLHPKTTRLRDVMSEEIAVCEMGAGVEQAAELMRGRCHLNLRSGAPNGLSIAD